MTDEPLSGAHFALYRSVDGIGGAMKDIYPIPGYEDLVSGADGVIPKIDNTLAPGKYYLTELSPPADHDAHEEDIVFTVSANGVVVIDSAGHSGYLTVEGTNECNYILRVPNATNRPVELTVTKTVTGSFGDKTKEFVFTLTVEGAEDTDEYPWSKNGIPQAEPLRSNAVFTLRHGDSVKIQLPIHKTITIHENNQDYVMIINDGTKYILSECDIVDEEIIIDTNQIIVRNNPINLEKMSFNKVEKKATSGLK